MLTLYLVLQLGGGAFIFNPCSSVVVPLNPVCVDTCVDPTDPPPDGIVVQGVDALRQPSVSMARVVYEMGDLTQEQLLPEPVDLFYTIGGSGEIPSIDFYEDCPCGTCTCSYMIGGLGLK